MSSPAIKYLPLLLVLLTGCYPERPVFTDRFLAFGTLIDLTIVGATKQEAESAARAIEKEFLELHQAWHAWDPGPLGRVNEGFARGERFTAPPLVLPLIRSGQRLSGKSQHLFNPAIGRLIDAWGFHQDDPEGHSPPPDSLIKDLVENAPRMTDIEIEGSEIYSTNPAVKLDFGAFGKGYGIDLAVTRLKEMGIRNAIVNAGGDLRAIGSRRGIPWNIAIRRSNGAGVVGTISVSGDESVFTSGNYERRYSWKGKDYHHIIDPRTGYPSVGTKSVTVLHDDAITADAAATALFIAGPEKWHTIAMEMGIEFVLLVDTQDRLHMNPAMRERLVLLDAYRDLVISPPLTAVNTKGNNRGS
ncbi:MAG: FAD:protein FMN transferase [Gammaproteobacteria bacterium]|nr:FAD:protein FMN transferase [Gammaproteobacteria bacterium]